MVTEADIAKAQRQHDDLLRVCTEQGAFNVTVAALGEASSRLAVLKSELEQRGQSRWSFARRFTFSRLMEELFLRCRLARAQDEKELPILLVGCIVIGSFLVCVALLGFLADAPLNTAVLLSLGFATMVLVACFLIAKHCPIDEATARLASINDERRHLKTSSLRFNEASVNYHAGERHLRHLTNLLDLKCRFRDAEQHFALLKEQLTAQLNDRRCWLLKSSNWQTLRGIPFEKFLADVFQVLGYTVTLTSITGDQGVDIIACKADVRLAIQAKGVSQSVGNGAVQEVFAGMKHHRCTHCLVITNSSFTRGARQLARSVECRLVDRDAIADLINGKIL